MSSWAKKKKTARERERERETLTIPVESEHVLKTTRKNYCGRLTTQTALTQEGNLGKHGNTAENNKTLVESKAHDSNWLEDCALEGHHHREVNRSDVAHEATWASTSAGVSCQTQG